MQQSLSRLYAQLRASFRVRRLGKSNAPAQAIEVAQGPEVIATRDWRRDFQRMDELEASLIDDVHAPRAFTVGGVVIFGSHQFYGPSAPRSALDHPFADQSTYQARNLTLRYQSEAETDFSVRWADAICAQIGLDEFQAFLLARRKRLHSDTK